MEIEINGQIFKFIYETKIQEYRIFPKLFKKNFVINSNFRMLFVYIWQNFYIKGLIPYKILIIHFKNYPFNILATSKWV